MQKMLLLILLIVLGCSSVTAAENRININIPQKLFKNSPVSLAVSDVKALLKESFSDWVITYNEPGAKIDIHLAILADMNISTARVFPSSILYPVHFYKWKSEPSAEGSALSLTAPSEMGIVFGLYGLLQEKLGFRFYHPKNTYIPKLKQWPLPTSFTFTGRPRFDKKGFHLHTMHPMELTEQLHSRMDGTALSDVKEYIDWLVRNGQNVMQFWLLRTVNRESWPAYAKKYVKYAKKRGVLTGAVISLSTLQQKAFQAINLLKLKSYTKQIDDNLEWLMQVPFDYISIDYTMGEYLPDLSALLPDYKQHLVKSIKQKYGVDVMENTHVIKRKSHKRPECSGITIHSVMFYSLTEEEAPVYGNKNQRFMYDMMVKEKDKRETWYWPESSYWVTFDTSVPLFLLPYLKSRYDDIIDIEKTGIDGHVTFTSGWEWGYWIIDYSIARWSWNYSTDGTENRLKPMSILTELFTEPSARFFDKALSLQEKYLKDNKLITLLSAKTPFEELPWPFNKEFQPTGGYSMLRASIPYMGKSDRDLITHDSQMLKSFYSDLQGITESLQWSAPVTHDIRDKLRAELINSLRITALRAKHRSYTLLAGAFRNYNLKDSSEFYVNTLLEDASRTRKTAMAIVREMEDNYRYPVSLIARKMQGHTSYDFGYLYPVSDLFFWQREEKQATESRFDAFFMNMWSFWDTLGLEGLF